MSQGVLIQEGDVVRFNRPGRDGTTQMSKGIVQKVWKRWTARGWKWFGRVLVHGPAGAKMWRVSLVSADKEVF